MFLTKTSAFVRIARHQIGGVAVEGDVRAIGRNREANAEIVVLVAGAVGVDPRRFAGQEILDENVWPTIRVAPHQIGGIAPKSDEPAVGGDRGDNAGIVALPPGTVGADPCRAGQRDRRRRWRRRPFLSPATRSEESL